MNHTRDVLEQPFSRRYGYEALPEAMRIEHLSDELRIQAWNLMRTLLMDKSKYAVGSTFFTANGERFVERVLGKLTTRPEDEIDSDFESTMRFVKDIVLKERFHSVLDLVEFVANDHSCSASFGEQVHHAFERHAAPYRFDISHRPFHFVPRGSKEQGDAIQRAVDTLRQAPMDGASAHLRKAAEAMNGGRYADSVGNSIHAVESVARQIDPEAARTLGPALKSLKDRGVLPHEALAKAFRALYGYTSDEQGIRHALLDRDEANVGLDEAMFMYGACASFAAYLVSKHRQINE